MNIVVGAAATDVDLAEFTSGTLSGETSIVNGISDGSVSKDNVMKTYADDTSIGNYNITTFFYSSVTSGVSVRVTFDYYIPSGQSNVDGLLIGLDNSPAGHPLFDTTGSWTSADTTFPSGGTRIRITPVSGGSQNYTGANDPNDDIIYVTNMKLYVGSNGGALAEANGVDGSDLLYYVTGLPPRILATRNETNVVITELGSSGFTNFRIYRADDHRATFNTHVSSTTLPYTDTSQISGGIFGENQKYKAAGAVTGTKNGSPYTEVGSISRPVYTVGKTTFGDDYP